MELRRWGLRMMSYLEFFSPKIALKLTDRVPSDQILGMKISCCSFICLRLYLVVDACLFQEAEANADSPCVAREGVASCRFSKYLECLKYFHEEMRHCQHFSNLVVLRRIFPT